MTLEADLLESIASEPDAIEPRLVYADWLQAQEDPRGELIMVSVARQTKPDEAELARREKALIEQLANELVTDPLPVAMIRGWHLGFVDALELTTRTIHHLRTSHRDWLAKPLLSQVRELDIESKYARPLRFLRRTSLASSVRRLRFGVDSSPLDEETLAAVARELPKLEQLHLRCADVPNLVMLGGLPLKKLSLRLLAIADQDVTRIASAPWKLETLALDSQLAVPEDLYASLATLYDGSTLPTIKHFVVAGNVPITEVVSTIALTRKPGDVESFTADWNKATEEAKLRMEKYREPLAKLRFEPLLGVSEYSDADSAQGCGAFLNHRLERPEDALVAYQQALRIKPEHINARHGLGIALRKLKRNDESLVAFDTAINQSRAPSAQLYNARHYTLCELGRRVEAKEDLERAVKIQPNYADAWNNLGCERQYVGDVEGALAAFRRTMEIDAEHGYGRRNEGELLLEVNRPAEALPIFQELLVRTPNDPWMLTLRAQAELETGQAAAAKLTLDTRLEGTAENLTRPYLLRALAFQDLGQPARARADLDAAVSDTDCPGWVALTVLVRSFDDRGVWTSVISDRLVAPKEIGDAMTAWAKATRPAGATELHDAEIRDQLDCTELAIASALLADDRALAVQRAHAMAALYIEQGSTFHRKWWSTWGAVAALIMNRTLSADARSLLRLVMRALRGRGPIAELTALVG